MATDYIYASIPPAINLGGRFRFDLRYALATGSWVLMAIRFHALIVTTVMIR